VFDGGTFSVEETAMFRHGTAGKRSKDGTNRRGSRTSGSRHVVWPVTSLLDRMAGGQRTRWQPFTVKRSPSNTLATVHGKTFDVPFASVQRFLA
jgi:hypothetical protein